MNKKNAPTANSTSTGMLFATQGLALMLLVGSGQAVLAQGAASAAKKASTNTLEEVLVTARKRTENIQRTPIAVSAFSGDSLREQGITNAADLSKSVPSLQIVAGDSNQIFIRGIGQRGGGSRADPAVSVYLDGIFIPRTDGSLLDTVDIESVQVLRGPQGTLFGKNNNGGALVFTLVKPNDELSGYADATMGNLGTQRLKAGINIPINERLATRLAVNTSRSEGYVKEQSEGKYYGEDDTLSVALQALWDVSDTLAVGGLLFYNSIDGTGTPNNCQPNNPNALLAAGLGLLYHGDTDPGNPQAYVAACEANSQAVLPEYTTAAGDFEGKKRLSDSLTAGLTATWTIDESSTFKVIAGFRTETVGAGKGRGDNDGGRHDISEAQTRDDSVRKSFTLEMQYGTSFFDDSVDFVAGFFGQLESAGDKDIGINSFAGITSATTAALAGGLDGGAAVALINAADTRPLLFPALSGPSILSDFDITGETIGIFSQVTWRYSESWEFTAGGRWTEESRSSDFQQVLSDLPATEALITSLNPLFQSTGIPGFMTYAGPGGWLDDPVGLINNVLPDTDGTGFYNTPLNYAGAKTSSGDTTFREFTPMLSASWFAPDSLLESTLLDSSMVYLTWSNGFKSGFLEPAGADGLALVEPETLENLELGFKIDAFDRSLRINVALYDMLFENMQLIQVTSDSANALVVRFQNAAKAKITGGEVELTWLPIPGLMLSLNYSNNNYKFLEWQDRDIVAALAGNTVFKDRSNENFPVSPEKAASFAVQYSVDSEFGTFVPRLDVSFKDEVYLGFDAGSWQAYRRDPALASAEAYTLVDLRLSWINTDETLVVSAFAKNVMNETYNVGVVSVAESLGTFTQKYGIPRTFGINVRSEF